MVLWFKIFLSLSNITHLFPVYIRISSTILKFLQVFRKLAVFPLLLTKFSILLKSTCLLHAIFLRFIFNQKEKRGFIWSETFNFLLNLLIFIQEKIEITFYFRKIFVKQHEHEFFHRYFSVFFIVFWNIYLKEYLWVAGCIISIERLYKNVKIPHSKII